MTNSTTYTLLYIFIIIASIQIYQVLTNENTENYINSGIIKKKLKGTYEKPSNKVDLFSIGNIEMICKKYFDQDYNKFVSKKALVNL